MSSPVSSLPYVDAEFHEFVKKQMKEWNVLGASLAIVDDHNVYTKGYGLREPDGAEVTEDTLFNAASMSKSFTAAAVALLVDDNENYPQVKWDTPASHLIRDDFVLSDPYYTENVTLLDMLSHRTGMNGHDDVCLGLNAKIPSTPQSITRSLRHLPLNKPLRTEFQYNNLMFTAASYLTETVAKQPFADILKTRFWDPLGMSRTYLGVAWLPEILIQNPSHDGNVAQGCYWDKKTEKYVSLPDYNAPEGQGAGNIMSSAKDWAQWLYAMIHKTSAISEDSLFQLTRPRIICSDKPKYIEKYQSPLWYGMGWDVQYYRGYKVVSHHGGVPGFSSQQLWLPERKWGIVLFGNGTDFCEVTEVIAWTLLDEVLGAPKSDRTDWAKVIRERDEANKKQEKEEAEGGKDVFPDRPDPPLPMQLPLEAYAGKYSHPAYHELEVEIKDGHLVANAPDRTFGYCLKWTHLSGNCFLVERQDVPNETGTTWRLEGLFEVGVSGKVERMGIEILDAGDDDDYIWFDRVKSYEY